MKAFAGFAQILVKARPLARRVIPRSLHHLVGTASRRILRAMEARAAAVASGRFEPALPPEAFAGGPVLLVNDSLASGGAERQIVNVLLGLEGRLDRPIGLLCLRLGESRELDFFVPALAGLARPPRNVMPLDQARAQLQSTSPAFAASLPRLLAWCPVDVAGEALRFAAEFLQERPSVVHAWQDGVGLAAALAACATGVPRILICGRSVNPTRFSHYRPYMREAYRLLACEPRVILANNSEAGARDYAAWLGLDPNRFVVIRNGVDLSGLRRPVRERIDSLRSDLGLEAGDVLVGSMFRLFAEKRPLLWIRTAAAILERAPRARFVLFGDGPMRAQVEREIAALGLGARFRLAGLTDDVDLALAAMDVFLLTSIHEGTPNVVLEAGALGVPVVATEAGGVAETLLEGRTGFVLQKRAGESEAELAERLAERVAATIIDHAWRQDAALAAPHFVHSRFGVERMLDETRALYALQDGSGAAAATP